MRLRAGAVALLAAGIPSLLAAQEKAKDTPAPAVPPAAAAPAPADPNAAAARITLAELKRLLEKDKVLVVDVRSADAYKASHIPGSVSAPLTEIDKHVAELKSGKKPIVTYCT
jgi:3-mercaptopyruvate sulfurtransferase SseA